MAKKGPQRLVMDCTLRDGGYVNDWAFDTAAATRVADGLYDSGVRYIELGILGKGARAGEQTQFNGMEEVEPLLCRRRPDAVYAVLLNQSQARQFTLPPRSERTADLVRVAFFKDERLEALREAERLASKGYSVFLQAMATFLYSPEEIRELAAQVDAAGAQAFYIVDSFSTMYREDVRALTDHVLNALDERVLLGFHAHNNMQLAFSNAIEFLGTETPRPLIADACLYGMGRGGGNVPVELLMEYLNRRGLGDYHVDAALDVIEEVILPIFQRMYWGYSMKYYLTSVKETNSAYSWYLDRKGVVRLRDLSAILDRIPPENRCALSREAADRAMEEYFREAGR